MALLIVLWWLIPLFVFGIASYTFLLPPRNFPKNIPTIPFYVTLIPLFKDVDQTETYKKYFKENFRRYGAVKIFFGARWNILVQRPSFVAEVFKNEDIFAKSGNQKKIPYSVLAQYTGDNIISSHGENWRLYRSVIKPGLQKNVPESTIVKNAKALIDLFFEEQANSQRGDSVLLPQLLQRYTLANLSECLLGASFEVCRPPLAASRSTVIPNILTDRFVSDGYLRHFNDLTHRYICSN
jgi:cytochrome P450